MILTDTHTHLYAEQFEEDRQEMIKRSLETGVSRLFMPNIDRGSITGMMALAKQFPNHCFPMMGLHPCSVGENFEEELALVEEWHDKHPFCAVGEMGMDLYWDKTYVKEQEICLRRQIELAKRLGLPIVLHCRDAFDEIFAIVEELNNEQLLGIFHCFTGSLEEANRVISLGGFKLGIGGVVTFKNSGLDAVVKQIDLKHLVLETDAPYLSPTPYRGKRNESGYLNLVAQKVADLHEVTIEVVAEATTANSKAVYGF